jgi:GTP-binding protein
MFVDIAKIHIKAGDGGDGAVSFHREKYVAAGGPDGGDGGWGGNIVLLVDDNVSTLADFRYKRKYVAGNGVDGSTKRCSGKSAADYVIRVPRGTLVKDASTGRIVTDMSGNEPFIAAKGGRGGWGNSHFATATRQIPRFAKSGAEGKEFDLLMELKLLADVGLVGFPNVGKSTLISIVSEAKPKIANYHFTTLTPVLGVIRIEEGNSFVMADIPGLIEGASEGVGLGYEFLRHIDRCRLLVHIVDVSGIEGRNPIEDFTAINLELAKYNDTLGSRPQIVAANKSDMANESQIKEFEDYVRSMGYEFYAISAATKQGVEKLMQAVSAKLATLPPVQIYESEPQPAEDFTARDNREATISVQNGVYVIEGKWLLKVVESINFDDSESLQYFQKVLIDTGTVKKLVDAGIQDGDTVSVYDIEFDFVK